MENDTNPKTKRIKFSFRPFHKTKEGLTIGELRTESGNFICNIEEEIAKEIIHKNTMHEELVSKLSEAYKELCSIIDDDVVLNLRVSISELLDRANLQP